ncbi:hypothetical protein CG740_23355 [Streptomyces sp. CB01201]|nr:hypothetical protein CG740_23355 [Streptomyces sp. CB01201]
MTPLACRHCGDTDGPFTTDGTCEGCEPATALRSALEDGGWLDDNASRLMNAYAATILSAAAMAIRQAPDCETAARAVAGIARRYAS